MIFKACIFIKFQVCLLGLIGCEEEKSSEKVSTMAYDKDVETLDHFKTGVYSDALIYI